MNYSYHGKHESKKNHKFRTRVTKALLCVPFVALMASSSNIIYSQDYSISVVEAKMESFVESIPSEEIYHDFVTEKVESNVDDVVEEEPIEIVSEILPKVTTVYPSTYEDFGETFQMEVQEVSRELTREEKLQIIEEIHGIDEFEYFQIVSTAAHEGGPENYEECYDVLCVAYNRTLSKAWCWSCKQETGKDGTKIIDQLRWIGQFSGFLPNEAGYDRDKYEGTEADRAALDFLYSLDRTNDYLCFCAPWYEGRPASAVQLHPEINGNAYYRLLTEDDYNEKAIETGIKVLQK